MMKSLLLVHQKNTTILRELIFSVQALQYVLFLLFSKIQLYIPYDKINMLWCSFTVSPTCFGVWPPVTQEVAAGGPVVSVRSGVSGWAASCWALPAQLSEDPLVCFPVLIYPLSRKTSGKQCWTQPTCLNTCLSDCVFRSDLAGAEPAGVERQLCCVEAEEVVKEELRRCRSVSVQVLGCGVEGQVPGVCVCVCGSTPTDYRYWTSRCLSFVSDTNFFKYKQILKSLKLAGPLIIFTLHKCNSYSLTLLLIIFM